MNNYFEKMEQIFIFIKAHPNSTLLDIANHFSISPTYLQKSFKQFTGISPKEYLFNLKMTKIQQKLHKEKSISITQAIYDSGYESASQFYEKSQQLLGMKPSEYYNKSFEDIIMLALGECSLGSFLIAQTKKGICSIALGDSPEDLLEDIQQQFPKAFFIAGDHQFEQTVCKVISFIEQPHQVQLTDFSLDIKGTIFQQKVWKALTQIPIGSTVTYSDIANIIGLPQSVRAVAKACATNKIAVLIPCHRVVKKDGNISGYRWGIERKKTILSREKSL